MEKRICKYSPCGIEFVPKHHKQEHHNPVCRALHHRMTKLKAGSKEPVVEHASFKARGIVQDGVHPNERPRDMSQHIGTFKIDEDGKILTR